MSECNLKGAHTRRWLIHGHPVSQDINNVSFKQQLLCDKLKASRGLVEQRPGVQYTPGACARKSLHFIETSIER